MAPSNSQRSLNQINTLCYQLVRAWAVMQPCIPLEGGGIRETSFPCEYCGPEQGITAEHSMLRNFRALQALGKVHLHWQSTGNSEPKASVSGQKDEECKRAACGSNKTMCNSQKTNLLLVWHGWSTCCQLLPGP